MSADLHCHTKMSDGASSIDEVVLLAKGRGLSAISVTDHDTFAGATRAKIFGERHGIEVIPGAEFSAMDTARGRKAHILCYCCAHPDRLEKLCRQMGESRRRSSGIMVKKVLALYPIPLEMVIRRAQGSTNIFKAHIMHALMDAGYADSVYGSLYQKLFSSMGGLCYCPVEYPDVHQVIREIHGAGGLAVLAHPSEFKSMDLLQELAENGELDGVEIWHPRNREEEIPVFQEIAEKYHLVMTGGTDFHGMNTSNHLPIGSFTTPEDQLAELKRRGAAG